MKLIEKLRGQMTGGLKDKERRLQILTALLEAFERGGEDATSELLEKMNELERDFDERLAALKKQL